MSQKTITLSPSYEKTLFNIAKVATRDMLRQADNKNITHGFLNKKICDVTEAAMLEEVMYHIKVQTKAAEMLGINRATLRTRLKRYDLL